MATNENIVQILLQAKDLASEAIKKLQDNMEQLPTSSKKVNDSTLSLTQTFSSLKEHWLAVSAAIVAGWMAIEKAAEWAKLGAAALQAEESFKSVTAAYDVEGSKLLVRMKEVSAGMIDESALMQRAVKALQQGLSADQIVNLLEVSRTSARVAGTDIAAAFDGITNAVANQTTRALKLYGIVIDNNKAFEDYAKVLGVSKDALTEQQQSQALANATIAEGQRQMKAMGDITLNASDKIQQAVAQTNELKETIGKGILVVTQAAGGAMYWLASGAMVAATGIMKLGAGILYVTRNFEEAKQLNQDAETMFEAAGETAAKGMKIWDGISLSTKDAAEATKGLAKQQRDAADAAALASAKQKAAAEMTLAVQQAKVKNLEASTAYEIALEKKRYEEGKVSLNEYIAFVKAQQAELTQAMIKEKQLQLAALQADPKISAADRVKKEKEIQGQITDIITKSKTEQLKVEEELTKGLKQEQTNAFNNWKNLQELKLQSLKANLDLQNAIDDAAVKSGSLAESQAMQNKLDRLTIYSNAQIQKAQETADRIAALEAQGFYKTKEEQDKAQDDYKAALSEKENLQLQLQQTIITSEQQIAETKKKETQDAETFIAGLLQDRYRLDEVERQKQLDQLNKYYQQGLISATDYYDALDVLDKQYTSEFKRDLQERSEQLNLMAKTIEDRTKKMWDAVQGFIAGSGFDDVKKYFGDVRQALATDIDGVKNQVSMFLRQVNSLSYGTFWSTALFGRQMVQMVGTTIYEWAQRVTDYIQYVRGLMASLQDTIDSYRLQLMQLRGDRMGELDAWMKAETKKLEEQYSDELGKTAEYYKAKELLDELYTEKKKKLLEEMKQAEEDAASDNGSGGSGGSGSGGVGGAVIPVSVIPADYFKQLVPDISSMMQSTSVSSMTGDIKKTVEINANLNIKNNDQDYLRRLFEDSFWPMLRRKFELIGINLHNT